MINQDRLVSLFQELVSIDNPSREERAMCDKLKEKLEALQIDSHEDGAAEKIGGQCGNLYAYVEGQLDLPPILLSSHMDCVDPAKGKKAIIQPDGIISSNGTTVLGADNLCGVAVILEVLTALKESGIPHRPLEILFDVAEETYCIGIQQVDFSKIRSKEAYVFDMSGPVGNAANQAPTMISFRADFHGRAAHAAFSPESGIHAIKAAANAIATIECGRVEGTTVNIGIVHGGTAGNIVPEVCTIIGEVRSFRDSSAKDRLKKIEQKIRTAAENSGAAVDFSTEYLCSAYVVDPKEAVVKRFQKACSRLGLKGGIVSTYGGSVNNHFYTHGIRGLVVAAGMNLCHSCQEYSSVSELTQAADLALEMVLSKE